jgi:hypothetical protein
MITDEPVDTDELVSSTGQGRVFNDEKRKK